MLLMYACGFVCLFQRIKQLQEKAQDPSLVLRLSVDGGGCSGFQYKFEMEPEKTEEDDM